MRIISSIRTLAASSRAPRTTLSQAAIGLIVLTFAAPAPAGVNAWTFTGAEGGAADAVTVRSADGVVFMTSGNTIFRSSDLGQSWTAVYSSSRTSVGRIVIDPTDPKRMLAASPGNILLYRSDDSGQSFALANAPGSLYRFAVLGSTLYAAQLRGKVFRSTTFGAQWEDRSGDLPPTDDITDIVVDPQNAATVYVLLSSSGLYKTVDGGGHWVQVNSLSGIGATKLAIDYANSNAMLLATATSGQGLLSSTNGGTTWTTEQSSTFAWVGFKPSAIGTGNGAAVAIPYIGHVLYRSDRNQAWSSGPEFKVPSVEDATFNPGDPDMLLLATVEGALITRDGGVTFAAGGQGVHTGQPGALASAKDGTLYASYVGGPVGVYRRTGSSWAAVDNTELKARLLNPLQPGVLATDPNNSSTLFVASLSELMQSSDGGQSWAGPHPTFLTLLPRAIAVDPGNSQTIYVATSDQGILRSDNGGGTFTAVPSPFNRVAAVAVDAHGTGTIYAAIENPLTPPLLFVTKNGGTIWLPADAGLSVQSIASLVLDPSNPQTLYAGGSGAAGGTFKSTNAGQLWTRVGAPEGNSPGLSLAIDPVVPTTVYMAIGVNGGVSRSVDGGATWEALPVSGSVRLLTVDPAKPSNLIVGRTNGGLAEIEIAPDLATTIPSSPAVLGLGGGGTATFRVTNRGPFAASSVKLTIDVAANTTASAFTPTQGSCAQTGATVTCALGGIRLNQQADVVLTLTGGAAASTGVVTATVAAHESDPVASNDAASATIEVLRLSDLSASLSASAATVDHNAPVTLTAVASNAGPNDATAAQLTVALGAGYTFQSATPSQGSCSDASGTVTCDLGPIAANAQASVALNVLAADTGTLTASATVSSAGRADGNAANDSATTSVTSRPIANVGVRIADSADPAVSGQPFQYTVTVTNAGPDDLAGGTAQITLTGSTASSAVATQGTCAAAGATVSCPLGAVPKNGTATITISATPSFAGSATASANLAHNAADPDSSNDHASESTVVNAPPSSGGGGSGGGGGGAGILELALLLALTALRGIQRSRRGRQVGGRGSLDPHLLALRRGLPPLYDAASFRCGVEQPGSSSGS